METIKTVLDAVAFGLGIVVLAVVCIVLYVAGKFKDYDEEDDFYE